MSGRTARAARASSGRPRSAATSPAPPPGLARERAAVLSALHAVVPMLGAIVGEHIEVVLHDLTRPEQSVLRIANGHVTGRKPGSAVLAGPGNDKALAILAEGQGCAGPGEHLPVFPYPTLARDARPLTSGTVMFRDASGQTFAALCLNADYTGIEAARAVLQQLVSSGSAKAMQVSRAETPDMEALMREIIDAAVRRYGKPIASMNKEEKTAAVETMFERGLFIVKGGVEKAAQALGVTRYTIYNYLDAIKARRTGAQG